MFCGSEVVIAADIVHETEAVFHLCETLSKCTVGCYNTNLLETWYLTTEN